MTGQGDKNHEQIKKARRVDATLDLSKSFRTVNGCRVRNLESKKVYNTVIHGRAVQTSQPRWIIEGEVYTQNKWLPAEWNHAGKHPQEQFSLEYVTENKEQQGNLF
jgi:hypothetical protein